MTTEQLKGDYKEYEQDRDRIMRKTNMDTDQLNRAWRKIPIVPKFRRRILDEKGFFRV